MSHHIFQVEPYTVRMGFDRPCQGFFLTIDMDDEIQFSNLELKEPHPRDLTFFLQKLKEFEIELPPQMIKEIRQDAADNMGNKGVLHSLDNGIYKREELGNKL